MRLESIDTRAWRRLSKIAHSETTVATANGQGIELAECLQMVHSSSGMTGLMRSNSSARNDGHDQAQAYEILKREVSNARPTT
jgi:hypothetical protein